ncbi:MAG: tetratricopeptide repeat protein [Anaerolineales bacterium]|nr:tetratricopeptide repeat protein [Anaerolineales bacterium]
MPDASPTLLDNYKAAANANPASAEAQTNLGWGYYGQRQYAEAIETFRQALTLDNRLIDAHYGLGLALKEAGAGAEAVKSFEAVIKLAAELENAVRGQMMVRLARGHINQIQLGDWRMDSIMRGEGA